MTTAVYPGTFDPMTNGHVDLVRRASRIFDHVVVGVAESRKKRPMLSLETRVALARGICREFENVTVQPFDDESLAVYSWCEVGHLPTGCLKCGSSHLRETTIRHCSPGGRGRAGRRPQ